MKRVSHNDKLVTNSCRITLHYLINVLHAYLFLRTFSYHHNLISLHVFFTLGVIHAKNAFNGLDMARKFQKCTQS